MCEGPIVPALVGRPDYEYGITRRLDYWRCQACGYVFADPIPTQELKSFYADYPTHSDSIALRGLFWRLALPLSPKPDRRGSFESLCVPKTARILDYGCGGGEFLSSLHDAGYRHLFGYDFDDKAAAFTLPFVSFEREGAFDVITLNGVIEHVERPAEFLAGLLSMLNDGGFIYIRTPNRNSILSRVFGEKWRGWETPRHLQLFDADNLRETVLRAGGAIKFIVTSNDMFTGIFVGSMGNVFGRRFKKILCGFFYIPAAWFCSAAGDGDELVAVIHRGC
jgi:SAM-dependent methyltransferase